GRGDNNRESEYRRSLASSSTSSSRDDRHHRDDHSRSGNVAGTTSSTSKFDLIQPSPTVIIQSLHLEAQEKDIEAILKEDGFVARNVSVIRERNSESRGFAFVDFDNENMARDWIIKRQQKLVILGQRSVLNYSRNKKQQQPNQQQPTHVADWTCNKCNGLNFGSRHKFGEPFVCFKCNTIRDESDVQRQDQHQQNKDSSVCANPCNVLMIRGMDFSTEEEKIRMEVVKLTSKVLYDVRLIRDKITDMSRGFAFIELGTTEDAQELMEVIERMDPPFEIDGRRITVGYARNGYNAPLGGKKTSTGVVSKETAAQNALAQATAANPNSTPLEYSSHNVTGALQNPSSTGPTDGSSASTTALAIQGFTYDAASGYYYDSNTGLYYDSSTGYYYNSTTEQWLQWDGTQYHVINQDGSLAGQPSQQKQQQQHAIKQPPPPSTPNPAAAHQTQQQQQQHYTQQNQYSQQLQPQQLSKSISTPAQNALMIASDQHQKNQLQAGTPGQQASGESVQLGFQKPKSARKIAKDMERWAKKLNTQTETKKAAVKQAQQELRMLEQKEEELRKKIQIGSSLTESLATVAKAKDGIRSLFVPDNDEEGSVLKLGSALQSNNQKPRSSLVADYPDDDFDNDNDVIDESQFVDLSKMACLLCQRQLTSQENLTKHLTMSQLHKQNLEKYKRSKKNKR
uniref:RRM domain-containing protein n=3 Tax=Clytia hemisphaerica TaxID=252671 RepID=A0A7M5VEI3_9CNID